MSAWKRELVAVSSALFATVIVLFGVPTAVQAASPIMIAADDSSGAGSDSNMRPGQATPTTPDSSASSNVISDSTITAKVKSALLADDQTKGADIKVKTSKGQVVLSGLVDKPEQSTRAVQVAKNVEGVKRVRNHITVNNLNLNPNNPSKGYSK